MSTAPRVLVVDPQHPEPHLIAEAANAILMGSVVAFPTETVYGLGADAMNPKAVAGIFEAKGRPAWNPVIVHVASAAEAQALVTRWPDEATTIAESLWPGPVTIVLPKAPRVPDIVSAGLPNVGIRIPAHPVALALIRAAGTSIAAPSANRFSEVSPTEAQHVVASLGSRVGLVLSGGSCDVGIESTVIDLTGDVPVVLRPGMITRDRLESLLGREVDYRSATVSGQGAEAAPQSSPGTAARHYAPRAEVWLFESEEAESLRKALISRQLGATNESATTRSLLIHADPGSLGPGVDDRTMPAFPDLYARELYRELHDADNAGVRLLLLELPPRHDSWAAIRDRLTRASR